MSINGSSSSSDLSHQRVQAPAAAPWMHQYPGGAPTMVMPHHMIPSPVPPHHHHHQFVPQHFMPAAYAGFPHVAPPPHSSYSNSQIGSNNNGENKTVWVGDLLQWMDENYLHSCFANTGEVNSVKVIRNKQTGVSEGYGFVEFQSHAAADKVLQTYPGIAMPNTDLPFRLNWASFSMGDKRSDNAPDLSIFVGDLAADVNDTLLHETFANRYPSVKAAKVVFDANTGRSKGYGFVRFGDESERTQAMTEMNGVYCSSRAMRIGPATPKKSTAYQGANGGQVQSEGDTTNTTIFVGGLDPSVTDDDLKKPFSHYGEILSVKIPLGKGCGFVQFSERKNAEEALEKVNGTVIGKQTVRLSWGRNPANKMRSEFGSQWGGGPYYGGQVYDGYGYAMPSPHNPSMYAAAYGSYPVYGSHQQQVS